MKFPIIIKALTNFIPYAGGAITSVWSDMQALQAQRKLKRLEVFYTSLKNELEVVQDNINSEFISKDDFLDIFEQTSKYIVNERLELKRTLFKNILVSSIVSKTTDYDKTEKFMHLLDEMDELELNILAIFLNPGKYNEGQQGEIIKDPNWISPGVRNGITIFGVYKVNEMLCKICNQTIENVDESLYFLERSRLVVEGTVSYSMSTNGHPINILNDKLTKNGREFISFLLRPEKF